jgi:hypothetical protein
MDTFAITTLKKQLESHRSSLIFAKDGLYLCNKDKDQFPSARKNLPFYKKRVAKLTKEISSLTYAVNKLEGRKV